jgi:hypothetical protein
MTALPLLVAADMDNETELVALGSLLEQLTIKAAPIARIIRLEIFFIVFVLLFALTHR